MTSDSTVTLLEWDNPEPGVYEAFTTRTTDVALEVYESNDEDDSDLYAWWALSEGRVVAAGEAVGLEEAKAQCEAAL